MGPKTAVQHVVPHENKWGVKAEDSQQPSKLFDTKFMASAYAFDIAKNQGDGKVVIHDKDGTFKDVSVTEDTSKLMTMMKG